MMRGDSADGSSATRTTVRWITRAGGAAALAVLVMTGPAGAGSLQTSGAGPRPDQDTPVWGVRAERLASTYDCSPTGLEPGVLPIRAVVRDRGEVRLASFEEGWAMYQGERPGTLIAVCRR